MVAPSSDGLSIIDLCLRLHAEQLSDLYGRWQQLESKANSVITGAGIVLAALAVLLQVDGYPTCTTLTLICIGGLGAIVAIFCAIYSQRVEQFVAPPSSTDVQRVLIAWASLGGERDPARAVREVSDFWSAAITDVEKRLPRKNAWIGHSQLALAFCSIFFLAALVSVAVNK